MSRRLDFVNAARAAKGTPWQHQGRHPGLALDCIGLILAAAKATGLDLASYERDIPNYGRTPNRRELRAFLKFFQQHLIELDPAQVQVGDVALMSVHCHPMHCGIITDFGNHGGLGAPFGVIHTWTQARCVTEHRAEISRQFGFFSFWRIPGIDD